MPEGGGIQGLIVNKVDGSTMEVGSGHLIDHALRSYEQGYTSAVVDLVVTEVRDEERTVEAIHAIGPTEVEVSFEADTVWRIRKRLTREEIGARLAALPCVFADLRVDGHMERLDGAANDRLFAFRTFPR